MILLSYLRLCKLHDVNLTTNLLEVMRYVFITVIWNVVGCNFSSCYVRCWIFPSQFLPLQNCSSLLRSLADSLSGTLSSYVLCSNFVFKIPAWAVSLQTAWQLLKNSVVPLCHPEARIFFSYVQSVAFCLQPKIRNERQKGSAGERVEKSAHTQFKF